MVQLYAIKEEEQGLSIKLTQKAEESAYIRDELSCRIEEKEETGGIKMRDRLYKSGENKMLCGICGGIGEYLGIDPTLIRLGWVLFCAIGGSGFLAYVIAAIIIPERPEY